MSDRAAGSTRELVATAVLLLISDGPSGGTAIVIDSEDAPSFVVLGGDTEEGFARLRRGAIAYGMPESYQAVPRDMVRADERVLAVGADYVPAGFDRTGSLFGPNPEKALVPVRDGRPYQRILLPIPSLERPAVLEFALVSSTDAPLAYALHGEARERDGYICAYCGRLCERKEPHTSAHGAGGHLRVGATAGLDPDPAHGPHPEEREGPSSANAQARS